jgi:hypothetical protein
MATKKKPEKTSARTVAARLMGGSSGMMDHLSKMYSVFNDARGRLDSLERDDELELFTDKDKALIADIRSTLTRMSDAIPRLLDNSNAIRERVTEWAKEFDK